MSSFVSASGTPSAMMATTRMVGCRSASMLDWNALRCASRRLSEHVCREAGSVCMGEHDSPDSGPHHAGKVYKYVGARVRARSLRHAALHGNGDLLAPEEHFLKAARAARLYYARHGGRGAACSGALRSSTGAAGERRADQVLGAIAHRTGSQSRAFAALDWLSNCKRWPATLY
jgi:hypothetical protein